MRNILKYPLYFIHSITAFFGLLVVIVSLFQDWNNMMTIVGLLVSSSGISGYLTTRAYHEHMTVCDYEEETP